MSFTLDFEENICSAATALLDVKAKGGALFILTGAGMSVQSGVPVFRSSDGSMSAGSCGLHITPQVYIIWGRFRFQICLSVCFAVSVTISTVIAY